MFRKYIVGLDLGQAQDYSALALVERAGPWHEPEYRVRHLRRWPLGTRYPAIVADVAATLRTPPLPADALLAVDKTGVGAAVFDLFVAARLPVAVLGVTITAGDAARREGRLAWVPKRDLVAAVVAPLQTGRLKIAPGLPEAATLVAELQNFRAKIGLGGHDSYGVGEEWRAGQHDDLVLALAIAVWAAERVPPVVVRSY